MKEQLTAVFQKVSEGYIAFVEELPGANAQGDTLEEARSNIREAVQLVLEANRALSNETLHDKWKYPSRKVGARYRLGTDDL